MFVGGATVDIDHAGAAVASGVDCREMRLEFQAVAEQFDGLVPLHVEVGFAGLLPDFDELVQLFGVFAVGVGEELERFDGFVLADDANDV